MPRPGSRPSRRELPDLTTVSNEAAISTSDPRATRAGADALHRGANAVDAAVAAALVLFVVEPHACGLGGDGFAIVKEPTREPVGFDGSGMAPAGIEAALGRAGLTHVPDAGALSVSVPGVVGLLDTLLARYGSRGWHQAGKRARRLAEDGFEVRPTLAAAIAENRTRLAEDPVLSRLFLADADPVGVGSRIRNPDLARALETISTDGTAAFYQGAIADAVCATVDARGGVLDRADMERHRTEMIEPVSTPFGGADVVELGAPTQGQAVLYTLEKLNRLGDVTWPAVIDATVEGLASVGIDLRGAGSPPNARGDTTYVAVLDRDGMAVSLIASVFDGFGSGVGVEALGSALHNRAASFRYFGQRPRHGKPPSTTIPALVLEGDETRHILGVTGGFMQAQGQVQLLVRLLASGESPYEAVNAPRFRVLVGGDLALEPGHPLSSAHPSALSRAPGIGGFGGAQLVSRLHRTTAAIADPRRGGMGIVLGAQAEEPDGGN